ncbi:MAG: carbohydrate-binding domain-containing protein [Solobacterium sp.]|nr:carbohydrate-binding domain-containing protein [Solobacterium sp.]
MKKKNMITGAALALSLTLAGCSAGTAAASPAGESSTPASAVQTAQAVLDNTETLVTDVNMTSGGAIDTSDLFTERDLTQTADVSEAVYYTVQDGESITISAAGVYVLSGTAENMTVIVNAGDSDKVQLVLNGVSITNESTPCIFVENADKVFVTTSSSDNTLTVTGAFAENSELDADAVITSKDDIVFNGVGVLSINSSEDGIDGKDDVKFTGGTLNISCQDDAIEANDSFAAADGKLTINAADDGIHAENEDDNTKGSVYFCGGTYDITAGDDAVHGETIVQIDGGTFTITGAEGLEGTWVQINGGDITINASDDGINAANKSSAYTTAAEINGGTITITMGAGDTDAVDSNGNLIITGGTIDITAQFPFDYDGQVEFTGGTVTVNGQQVTAITNQMMGGMPGQMPQDGQTPPDGPQGQRPEGGPMGGGMPGQMHP